MNPHPRRWTPRSLRDGIRPIYFERVLAEDGETVWYRLRPRPRDADATWREVSGTVIVIRGLPATTTETSRGADRDQVTAWLRRGGEINATPLDLGDPVNSGCIEWRALVSGVKALIAAVGWAPPLDLAGSEDPQREYAERWDLTDFWTDAFVPSCWECGREVAEWNTSYAKELCWAIYANEMHPAGRECSMCEGYRSFTANLTPARGRKVTVPVLSGDAQPYVPRRQTDADAVEPSLWGDFCNMVRPVGRLPARGWLPSSFQGLWERSRAGDAFGAVVNHVSYRPAWGVHDGGAVKCALVVGLRSYPASGSQWAPNASGLIVSGDVHAYEDLEDWYSQVFGLLFRGALLRPQLYAGTIMDAPEGYLGGFYEQPGVTFKLSYADRAWFMPFTDDAATTLRLVTGWKGRP